MNDCLDDIQIEEALSGPVQGPAAAHLSSCEPCRRRLAQAQAVRAGLRQAFADTRAPADLVERIRRATIGQPSRTATTLPPAAAKPVRRAQWLRHHWGRLAMAAGLLLLASLAVLLQTFLSSPAEAAATELVKLHEQNLSPGHAGMLMHEPHDQSEAYLSNKLGYKVDVPRDTGELRMRGCCVARFLGRQAANMVIQGPNGRVTVIVSDINAQRVMTKTSIVRDGLRFWVCPMKGFHTVAVQKDKLIYSAVGDDTPEHLVSILCDIIRQHAAGGPLTAPETP